MAIFVLIVEWSFQSDLLPMELNCPIPCPLHKLPSSSRCDLETCALRRSSGKINVRAGEIV